MLQAATGVLTGSQRPTQQKQDLANSAKLIFNQENYVDVVMENLRLQKELNEALEKVLKLKKESNRDFLRFSDLSPHLKIA